MVIRGISAKLGRAVMLKFHDNGAPDPMKLALFLEESGFEHATVRQADGEVSTLPKWEEC